MFNLFGFYHFYNSLWEKYLKLRRKAMSKYVVSLMNMNCIIWKCKDDGCFGLYVARFIKTTDQTYRNRQNVASYSVYIQSYT